jgi:HEAT repeat protein
LPTRRWTVRRAIARSLGRIGPSALVALTQLLDDRNPSVRAEAARSLGNYRAQAREVTPALIATLGDYDPQVRAAAANSLGRLGAAGAAANAALELAQQDLAPEVAAAAHWALERIGR